jgi:hypothetical protein
VAAASATDLAGYAIIVHGIKSTSRGICANALGTMAESLEFAAKDGNIDFILQHNPDFIKAAHTLIEDIKALLNNAEKLAVKPKKGKPGETELKRLCDACADYDIDGIEAAMREIEGYEYTDDGGLADWLRDNVARLNYTQVVEKIIQMTKVVEE